MLIAGVDEAGRGPVIGPMVMACVVINQKHIKRLEDIGVKDSKELTPKKREFITKKLKKLKQKKIIKIFVDVIHPREIDNAVKSKSANLNKLEAERTVFLLSKSKADKAFVDCPSNNTKAYKALLQRLIRNKIHKKIDLIVEHKAEKYPIVAAASIIAKVLRDHLVEDIKKRVGFDFGSGYPADPMTQKFMNKLRGNEDFIRSSWITTKRIIEKNKQKKLLDF